MPSLVHDDVRGLERGEYAVVERGGLVVAEGLWGIHI